MRLAHLHIPELIPFAHASRLQHTLVSRLLAYKKLSNSSQSTPAPDPTILTFTPHSVYTTGRRDLPSTPNTDHSLTVPQTLSLPASLEPIRHILTASPPLAEYHATLRGGQTTYHGPGQLVAYTILDLRNLRIGPRAHIRLLEESVLEVLATYGVKGMLNEDPGVWVKTAADAGSVGPEASLKKIAAVGVHLRRFVSSYGVGLNVTEEPIWYLRQIVACGLEGRGATSIEGQNATVKGGLREVADGFVKAFVGRINEGTASGGIGPKIDEVYRMEERDLLD
ncbi:hypothetical protein LOZ66_002676 [Ophidiomyces ophidiicola]|nr:hypothetical protein LOZ66_002676 [Ophidiomyces ophidiicola]